MQEHTVIASRTDTALTHERCLELLEVLGDHDFSAGIALIELLLVPHANRQHSQSQSETEQSEGIAACKGLLASFHDGFHPPPMEAKLSVEAKQCFRCHGTRLYHALAVRYAQQGAGSFRNEFPESGVPHKFEAFLKL